MKRTEKFWDKVAKRWDTDGNALDETSIHVIENTKKYLNPNDVVLDFGCGPGTITNKLAGSVREIHGSDISSGMIEKATKIAKERKIENAYFAKSTLFDGRYEKGTFSVITAYSILHLVEDPSAVIDRINELLQPGGVFVCFTPCLGENRTLFGFILAILSKIGLVPKINLLETSELETLIMDGHFKMIETEILKKTPTSYFAAAKKK